MTQPPSGPMIMAPRNIGIFVPAMTPIAAMSRPRRRDAVDHPAALTRDQQRQQVSDHRADDARVRHTVGVLTEAADRGRPGPAGLMKNAVIRPQAMKAPMLGIIMPDRNVPNFCTATLAPPGLAVAVVIDAASPFLLPGLATEAGWRPSYADAQVWRVSR